MKCDSENFRRTIGEVTMGAELNLNAVNEIPSGTIIYKENEEVQSVALILKGKVIVQREGVRAAVGSGYFLGINDLYSGQYGATYMATDGVKIFPFNINHPERIDNIFALNPEYGSLMIISLSKYIRDVKNIYNYLSGTMKALYQLMKNGYDTYRQLGQQGGYPVENMAEMIMVEEFQKGSSADIKKAEYYAACTELPLDVQKKYYSGNAICSYHVDEQAELVNSLINECSELTSEIKKMCLFVFDDRNDDLLSKMGRMVVNLKNSGQKAESMKLAAIVEELIEMLWKIDETLTKRTAVVINFDRDALQNFQQVIVTGEIVQPVNQEETQKSVEKLRNSLKQILDYAGVEEEKAKAYAGYVKQFADMPDKAATDDVSRKLRKLLAKDYYAIYKAAFLRDYKEGNCPLAVDLFLRYGLLDEKLLSKEQLNELVNLDFTDCAQGPCNVYDMKQWLTLVYQEKKLPSKSEFDLDFEENIRSMRKTNEITEAEAEEIAKDPLKKLEYEINNMFSYNNRIVSGQISTFVPFLYEGSFIGRVQQSLLTTELVNAAIKRIENIDYSVFVRELIYNDPKGEISKEYFIKRVYPDIILMPVSGTSGSMWQEFSGRRRDSKGRFLLPIFSQSNLDDVLIKLVGRFRWEVCRTVQGAAWNNIKYKSLTSEYMDYIQFYRKNRELSEDKKEKLKAQIQKGRSNTREVFVIDYEIWLKNESQGAIRLNKVSREILAMYCPFAREIRESIQSQPIFAEAMARYGREKVTKVKELDLRHRALAKDNIKLPPELEETYLYYKDM